MHIMMNLIRNISFKDKICKLRNIIHLSLNVCFRILHNLEISVLILQ